MFYEVHGELGCFDDYWTSVALSPEGPFNLGHISFVSIGSAQLFTRIYEEGMRFLCHYFVSIPYL